MTATTDLTGEVLAAYALTPDRRPRELLEALTRHGHAFAGVTAGLRDHDWRHDHGTATAIYNGGGAP